MIYIAIPSNSYIKKKEHKKLKTYPGLKEVLEKMWGVSTTVVSVVINGCFDSQIGREAPAVSRNNISDYCSEQDRL